MGLERMGTHSESCYKWHLECAVSRYEALRARVETAERAYEVEHANCVNLTEKVIPNLRARVAEAERLCVELRKTEDIQSATIRGLNARVEKLEALVDEFIGCRFMSRWRISAGVVIKEPSLNRVLEKAKALRGLSGNKTAP
jgi:hypothetical protein